jgi:hypothetical protein
MLNRTAMEVEPSLRATLVPSMGDLTQALQDLARDPGERSARQRAADRALDVARALMTRDAETDRPLAAANTAAQLVAGDIMVFAGISPEDVDGAVHSGARELRVPEPVPTAHLPFSQRPSR